MSYSRAMSRLAGLLVLALALLQGTGLEVYVAELGCAEEHHEGSSDSGCPPECATCPCCARVTFPVASVTANVVEPNPAPLPYFVKGSEGLPEPPPRGILHVPRLTA